MTPTQTVQMLELLFGSLIALGIALLIILVIEPLYQKMRLNNPKNIKAKLAQLERDLRDVIGYIKNNQEALKRANGYVHLSAEIQETIDMFEQQRIDIKNEIALLEYKLGQIDNAISKHLINY